MDENPLYTSVGSLFQELRGAATFILSIYEVLDQKLPDPARELWNEFGRLSERVLIEIEDQLGNLLASIDSYCPATAATQISVLASGWEKDAEQLSRIVDKIATLQIQLDDPQFNTILNEYLPSSVRGYGRIITFVRQILPEDL